MLNFAVVTLFFLWSDVPPKQFVTVFSSNILTFYLLITIRFLEVCLSIFFVIFRNEITTIPILSTSEGVEWVKYGCPCFRSPWLRICNDNVIITYVCIYLFGCMYMVSRYGSQFWTDFYKGVLVNVVPCKRKSYCFWKIFAQ